MEIFISWSGGRSKAVAELLDHWLKCVLQASKPWVSTRDIDPGSLWFNEINDRLKSVSIGIICLTSENKDNPWLLFEAGALAKGLTTSRVCPLLIDLESKDITDPLAQFNHTSPGEEGMFKLVNAINISMKELALPESTLKHVFETYWPQFEHDFKKIIDKSQYKEEAVPREDSDVLGEILSSVRSISKRVAYLESGDKQSLKYMREEKAAYMDELIKQKDILESEINKAISAMSRIDPEEEEYKYFESQVKDITQKHELIRRKINKIK